MNPEKQPGILCEGVMLIEEKFSRIPKITEDAELSYEFEYECGSDDNLFGVGEMKFTASIHKEQDVEAELELRYVGLFRVDSEEPNMEMSEFLKNAAPAIILPYIREHVCSMSAKAGLKPIYLPPVNIIAALKANEECCEVSE